MATVSVAGLGIWQLWLQRSGALRSALCCCALCSYSLNALSNCAHVHFCLFVRLAPYGAPACVHPFAHLIVTTLLGWRGVVMDCWFLISKVGVHFKMHTSRSRRSRLFAYGHPWPIVVMSVALKTLPGSCIWGFHPWRWQLSASRQQPPRAARPLALRRAPHRPVHADLPQGRGQGRGAGVEAQQFVAVGCHSVLSCIIRLSELDAARCWLTGCSGSECGERGLAGRGPTIMDILCTEATEVL